jgi:ActR/RegA family two-component response regulator
MRRAARRTADRRQPVAEVRQLAVARLNRPSSSMLLVTCFRLGVAISEAARRKGVARSTLQRFLRARCE